jgi:pectin methylesterase-like acyl-CoA thioesterase
MVRNLIISILLSLASASSLSYDRKGCQKPGNTKLKGCPKHTLVVGPSSNFTSIQHAILSLPNNSDPYVILIQPGNYTEQLNITRPGPLTLLGVTALPNDKAGNLVNVIWHNATGTATTGTYDNAYTSTLTVAPTLNSSFTGTGPTGFAVPADTPFGNIDFRTYNLNFINDYLPYAAGPSLALSLSYANGGFYYTRFLSYQDTVRRVQSFSDSYH